MQLTKCVHRVKGKLNIKSHHFQTQSWEITSWKLAAMNLKFDQDMKIVFKKRSAKTFSSSVRVQAILDFRSFDFRNFWFNSVYNSLPFSSPLVLLSKPRFTQFLLPRFFICVPTLTAIIWIFTEGEGTNPGYLPKSFLL